MATVEELCKELASSDQVRAYKANQSLLELAGDAGSPARTKDKAKLAQSLVAWVLPPPKPAPAPAMKADSKKAPPKPVMITGKDYPRTGTVSDELEDQARNAAFRILASVASRENVKAIQAGLDDYNVRESARCCLERMTCPEAGDALAEAVMKEVGVEFRVGLINSLGYKSGPKVITALKECTKDQELEVRLAAAEALANHADAAHDAIIVAVIGMRGQPQSGRRAAARLTRARLRLAEKLIAAKQAAAAKAIYEAVSKAKVDPAQQQAAQNALTRLG